MNNTNKNRTPLTSKPSSSSTALLPALRRMKAMKIRPLVASWSVGCLLLLTSFEIIKNRASTPEMKPALSNVARESPVGEKGEIRASDIADGERKSPIQGKDFVKIQEEPIPILDTKQAAQDYKEAEMCDFSDFRFNACDLQGDVRIMGKNHSSVILVTNSRRDGDGSWKTIKPYPRKHDSSAMAKVRPLNLTTLSSSGAPRCTVNHSVPAVVFSTDGHCGNCFHDFADVLVPLFETAGPFRGRVRFVIATHQGWWMVKYRPYLARLSALDVIDLNNDGEVHCFPRALVGLRAGRDLMIDPAKAPPGNSIGDFMALTRSVYDLPRDHVAARGGMGKPRILFIARRETRRFENMAAIRRVAEAVGFEVVVSEPDFFGVARFAHIVNSCDVMVGVHGAGLTNLLFLPAGGILVQVVPVGKLDWIATNFFAEPAIGRGLRYLQYDISVEESTLVDLYPRNHTVFVDPEVIHEQGWNKAAQVYLKQQSVRLDLNRFRPVLEHALNLLRQENS